MENYALAIANYFIDLAHKDNKPIRPLKLMKLAYIAHGFALAGFHIDNTVTIALISTTTANIIAVFVFVVKYLFHFKD